MTKTMISTNTKHKYSKTQHTKRPNMCYSMATDSLTTKPTTTDPTTTDPTTTEPTTMDPTTMDPTTTDPTTMDPMTTDPTTMSPFPVSHCQLADYSCLFGLVFLELIKLIRSQVTKNTNNSPSNEREGRLIEL